MGASHDHPPHDAHDAHGDDGTHTHGHAHGHAHGAGGHSHVPAVIKHENPLWIAFALTLVVLLVEIAGGLLSNSLALLSDAAHMMTDVAALGVSLFAVRMGRRPADARRSYGYARMEAIGALINSSLLFLVAGYILWEAIGRFRSPQDVASSSMLVVATIGLLANFISMKLLAAGAGENLNMQGAYLEVWSDMLGSLGVIAGAVLIHFTGWTLVDPIVAVLLGLWVLPRTWVLLKQAVHVLMQGVPAGVDVDAVRDAMQAVPGVAAVHDLHVWALGSQEPILTAHVLLAEGVVDADRVRAAVAAGLHETFAIDHATLQVEAQHCGAGKLHD
ncbi:MAG TPA: cation diffusion facilitator family transporter [Thermomonas sp.]|jgi:cobalt-zinc-cadmium efflux system protein|uniref:cation diffusion facilitator family transporter n=1 Tax=Thermomonas sp. TaxID=1971895 RepID=UPI002BEC73DA|nr:cation diffusion facilitator family transporter [Thermomonas sp.]HOV96885.1 cation diffusion facilitator family transporter [Thermomonas sp.]